METVKVKLYGEPEPIFISGTDINVDVEVEGDFAVVSIRDGDNLILVTPYSNFIYVIQEGITPD